MTDSHSHIYGPEFDSDREEVLSRARQAGVERILLPNINMESIDPMLSLCRCQPGYCFPMMGLHPEDVKEDWAQVLDHMERLLRQPDNHFISVGEVGLDFYWDQTYREQQIQAFRRQVGWAVEFSLPLVVHCRNAQPQLVQVLKEFDSDRLTGIFHCFGGTMDEAAELLCFQGFCLGIGGVLTYKKSSLCEVVRQVPIDRLVLETDAPYLAPVPYRGKRNESSFLTSTARRLAQEKGLTLEQVEAQTDANVFRLFPKISVS